GLVGREIPLRPRARSAFQPHSSTEQSEGEPQMKPKRVNHYLLAALLMAVMFLWLPPTLTAQQGEENNWVYPPDSIVFGMTYGDWMAAQWQYLYSLPTTTNPIFGADCTNGQSSGLVFFLTGSASPGPVIRTCTVPASKALWVPIILNECSTVEAPPYHGDNPQELRVCASLGIDGVDLNSLKLRVDGKKIRNLPSYRVQSPFYDFIMPATDNIWGINGVTSGSSVAD